MPRYRCAILDDYQNIALEVVDWSKVAGDLDIKVFNQHLGGAENVVTALQGFEIVCAMRERTAFPRAVIEKLPDLQLLITTGLRNASIDVAAAKERRVVVCGTRQWAIRPPGYRPHARAHPPHRLRERADEGRRALAVHHRARP